MCRGYLALALDQYSTAIEHFSAVLEREPSNLAAANNKAICLLYTCDLSRAVSTLEDVIRRNPELNLNETLVFNLSTLYDLQSDNSQEKKKVIMSLASKFASDSFDFSVLKL
jgi:tetratricopeptide (TPR) repeat protein